ncbi:MAG: hypothetical protein P8184_15095 [Calditrichia bacterium]
MNVKNEGGAIIFFQNFSRMVMQHRDTYEKDQKEETEKDYF